MGTKDTPTYTEFLQTLPAQSKIAADPSLVGAKTWIDMKKDLDTVELMSLARNLIDQVWTEENGRPPTLVRNSLSTVSKNKEF